MNEANIAILIDYENVGGLDSIQYLLDQLSDVGRVIIKRAYADWSAQRDKRDQLLELGIDAVHHFRSNKSGKNSSDISLAIDSVDLLHEAPVDTFVIVSSDSDFVPLVSKLRSAGKSVIGAGRREGASATLVKSCDRYIYIDDATRSVGRKESPQSPQSETDSLVVRAVEASMDDQGHALGSRLHQALLRIDPSFDFKAQGHRTFRHFLDSSEDVEVTRPEGSSDVIVQLDQRRANEAEVHEGGTERAWDLEVNYAWERRGQKLSGQAAAAAAARVLDVPRLSVSRFPSLDNLLQASNFLSANWRREGNTIIRR